MKRILLTMTSLLLLATASNAQTGNIGLTLVADINGATGGGSSPDQGVAADGYVWFSAYDPANGDRELYRSDGTDAGTERVADIHPTGSSQPRDLTWFNGYVYFTAQDGTHGREIFRSDGSAAGTELVLDINPGSADSSPNALVVAGGRLYFTASDGTNGREWWSTDGSSTAMVANLGGPGSSSVTDEPDMVVYNGDLYFTSQNLSDGEELWRISGTTTTLFDLEPGSDSSNPSDYAVVSDGIVFGASTTADGVELFHHDGTTLTALTDSDFSSGPDLVHVLSDGSILFVAEAYLSSSGLELYRYDESDPDGASLLDDINSGSSDSEISSPLVAGGLLYFSADDGTGPELWVSDGSSAGTEMVQEINPYGYPDPVPLGLVDGRLVFTADNDTLGTEFWITDATGSSASLIEDLNPSYASGADEVAGVSLAGELYVAGGPDSLGTELYRIGASSPPTDFSLLSPADGASIVGTADWELEHRWETSVDSDPGQSVQYTIKLTASLAGGDSSLQWSGLADTTRLLNLPDSLGLEHWSAPIPVSWHVLAISGGDSVSSDTASYTLATSQPPEPFATLAPADSAEFHGENDWLLEHRWEQSEDPDSWQDVDAYQLRLRAQLPGGDSSFSIVGLADTSLSLNLVDSLGLSGWFAAVSVEWFVTVISGQDSVHSDTAHYSLAPMADLFLMTPEHGSVVESLDTTLVWRDEAWPRSYTVLLDTSAELATADTLASGIGDSTVATGTLLDDRDYWWTVLVDGGQNAPDTARFSTAVPQAPESFALIAPADSSVVPDARDFPLSYRWEQATDPDPGDTVSYTLELAPSPDFLSVTTVDAGQADSAQVDDLAAQSWYWRVRASDLDGLETLSGDVHLLDVTLSVQDDGALPEEFAIASAWPNPFNASLTLQLALPERAQAKVELFNLLGQRVATLHEGELQAGRHRLSWNAGSQAAGSYLVRMSLPERGLERLRKVVLVK